MSIPMVDLHQQYQTLKEEIEPVVLDTLSEADYIMGENVKAFEHEVANYLDVKYALGVASGTDALHLALRACGVQPNDEVITPAFTFISTIEAILYCGATPIFVDIDSNNFHLDLSQLATLITPKTKAILPVHLYGNPVNMPALMSLANQYQLLVIEDAAQSFGATWNGQQTGSFGTVGCFSFYPSKNLSAFGDGGMIVTNSEKIYADLIALRNHGSYTRYHHEKLGYNSRLDEIQAAILRIKLKYINCFNEKRYSAAQYYSQLLNGKVETPQESKTAKHIYHQYTILHRKRDAIQAALQQEEIASMIYYPIPLHQQILFNNKYANLSLPNTKIVSQRCLSLPMFPELTTAQIEKVCAVIHTAIV